MYEYVYNMNLRHKITFNSFAKQIMVKYFFLYNNTNWWGHLPFMRSQMCKIVFLSN